MRGRRSVRWPILLAVLLPLGLLIAGGVWYARANLGPLAARLLKEQADKSLNGRLEFAALSIDGLGRAVIRDAAVYQEGIEAPVITCPRVTASVDLLNVLGVNRGRKSIALSLDEPRLSLLREPGGSFSLKGLFKPQPGRKSEWAVSARIRGAKLHFTDACLLDQTPLDFGQPGGLAGRLLAEAAYGKGSEVPLMETTLTVDASFAFNPAREQMSLDAAAELEQGGQVGVKGTLAQDGSQFNLTISAARIELATLKPYINSALPKLRLPADWRPGQAPPESALLAAAGSIADAEINLSKAPGQAVEAGGWLRLGESWLSSAALPPLEIASARAEYLPGKRRIALSAELSTTGLRVSGDAALSGPERKLSGSLRIGAEDIAKAFALADMKPLPLRGGAEADIRLSGSSAKPGYEITASSGALSLDGRDGAVKLGKASLKAELNGQALSVGQARLSGGALSASGSGELDLGSGAGAIKLKAGPAKAMALLDLAQALGGQAGTKGKPGLPIEAAEGNLSFEADIQLAEGRGGEARRVSTSFNAASPKLALTLKGGRSLKLGKASAAGSLTPAGFEITKASFTGGDIALSGSGKYGFASRDGKFSLTAGPADIGGLLAAYEQFNGASKPVALPAALKDATGKVSVSANVTIAKGRPTGGLELAADSLLIAGHSLGALSAKGQARGNSIEIESAECLWTPPFSANLAGHKSTGKLQLSVRAGGSLSLPPQGKGSAALAVTGKATTQNLAPSQALVSFKLAGPLATPQLKVQAKTEARQPLALTANLPLGAMEAPVEATASWLGMNATFSGTANMTAQTLSGKLSASDIDLARLGSGGQALSGCLSAEAQISGKFSEPAVAGRLTSEKLALAAGGRSYAITKLQSGFKLAPGEDGWALALSDGGFAFDGNAFSASGVLGKGSKEITLECPDFNLLSVMAMLPQQPTPGGKSAPTRPPLDVKSSGPLRASLGGQLEAPRLEVSYSSGAGSIAGQAFDSASLQASGGLGSFEVESFNIKSKQGALRASGKVVFLKARPQAPAAGGKKAGARASFFQRLGIVNAYAQSDSTEVQFAAPDPGSETVSSQLAPAAGAPNPVQAAAVLPALPSGVESWSASVELDHFDAAAAAPLSRIAALSSLKGRADGQASLSGQPGSYSADGSFKLSQGSYNGVAFESAQVAFRTKGRGVEITSATVTSGESRLSASGSLQPGALSLSAQAQQLDLALLAPLLPKGSPAIKGQVNGRLELSPGKGAYPDMSIQLSDAGGGLTAAGAAFTSASADATLKSDTLTIKALRLSSGQSSLEAGGKLAPELLFPAAAKASGKPAGLDFWVKAERFRTADMKPLLPKAGAASLPDGVVSCDLKVGGKTDDPKLSGPLSFQLAELPGGQALGLTGASGEVQLTANNFDIRKLTLNAEGNSRAVVTGSGGFSLNPFALKPGASIDINLSPDGSYFHPQAAGLPLDGTLGGRLVVSGSRDSAEAWVISGNLVVTEPKGHSIFTYEPAPAGQATKASRARLDKLLLTINPGTEFRYSPAGAAAKLSDLRASVQGQLSLSGVPGQTSGKDRLRLEGELALSDGSMRVYRHVVRLEGVENKLVWPKPSESAGSGGLAPRLTARAALTLDNVLAGVDLSSATEVGLPGSLPGMPTGGLGAGADDLTVYFTLTDVPLDRPEGISEAIKLSSQPPLPQEKIALYLLGGADKVLEGEAGLGEFAEGELVAFGSTFISRAVERSLGLNRFTLGGSGAEDNPYYVNMEKSLNDDVSFTYYRNFYTQTEQQEQYGLRYKLLESQAGGKYKNLELQMNFDPSQSSAGRGAEFMFTWTTKF